MLLGRARPQPAIENVLPVNWGPTATQTHTHWREKNNNCTDSTHLSVQWKWLRFKPKLIYIQVMSSGTSYFMYLSFKMRIIILILWGLNKFHLKVLGIRECSIYIFLFCDDTICPSYMNSWPWNASRRQGDTKLFTKWQNFVIVFTTSL